MRMPKLAIAGLGTAAALAALGVALAQRSSRAMQEGVSLASFGESWVDLLACDTEGVWLGVTRRASADEVKAVGVDVALGSQPFSLVRAGRTGALRVLLTEHGMPLAVSVGEDASLGLLFQDTPDSPTVGYSMKLSADGGASWSPVGAPRDVIGLALRSREVGYCWSTSRLYATRDGGKSWQTIDAGPGRLAGKMEPGRPTLGLDGVLWVPLHPGAGDVTSTPKAESKLVRVDGSSKATRVYVLPGEVIAGVAPGPAGGVYVALAPSMGPGCRVVRIANALAGDGAKSLWSQPKGGCGLQSATGLLLVDFTEDFAPRTFFSTWPHRALVSTDAGKTWLTRDLTRERVNSICPTGSGFWTLSQTSKRLRFHPVPGN